MEKHCGPVICDQNRCDLDITLIKCLWDVVSELCGAQHTGKRPGFQTRSLPMKDAVKLVSPLQSPFEGLKNGQRMAVSDQQYTG